MSIIDILKASQPEVFFDEPFLTGKEIQMAQENLEHAKAYSTKEQEAIRDSFVTEECKALKELALA